MATLAAQGQRSGKFRHVYGDAAKPELTFQQLKNPVTDGESRYVSANSRFIAVSKSAGGGPVYILDINKPGRIPLSMKMLSVQKGRIWDHDFHPFIPNMIATASDDCSVAVTSFPIKGLSDLDKNITTADVLMNGHGKKVSLIQFNPCVNSILASGSFDRTVRIWNIETGDCIMTYTENKDNIYSLEWNYDGSQLATTCKDKSLRIFDPRIPDEAASINNAFDSSKSSKCFWIPNLNWIGAVGFSKTAHRQLKFWNLLNLSEPIFSIKIDQVSSVLMPYYDNDNGLLYMAGKGDGTVQYCEIINDSRKWYPLGAYRSADPQKGGGWMSKRGCDVWKCEINRFFKLTKNSIIPISFIVPRKSGADVFQEDIYPHTFAGKPALSVEEWLAGKNKDPILISMDPEKQANIHDDDEKMIFKKRKTYQQLVEENQELIEKIKMLESKLKSLNMMNKVDNVNEFAKKDDMHKGDGTKHVEPVTSDSGQ